MTAQSSEIVQTARTYYNSSDADAFYHNVWGGEDIHIGLYTTEHEPIRTASRRTVATMAARLGFLDANSRVVDLGAGYGGAARWLASMTGCRVTCVNLSETQNERNRALTAAANFSERIRVLDGSFEDIPCRDHEFDVAWSQDSFLHSGDRERVLQEINRVLKRGGEAIFTDPMQADDCPPGVLRPVLERIHLDSLASIGFYRQQAEAMGWEELAVLEMTDQLVRHYTRVREELLSRRAELRDTVSDAYIDRMVEGLGHWITAGERGYLKWGILHFRTGK
jgi:ubiquinone/menaquinone biosynthesis C-methylase UbiE